MEIAQKLGHYVKELQRKNPLTKKGLFAIAGLTVAAVCNLNSGDPEIKANVTCSAGDSQFDFPHADLLLNIKNVPSSTQGSWILVRLDSIVVRDATYWYASKGGFNSLSTEIHGGLNMSPKSRLMGTEFKEDYPYVASIYTGSLQENTPNFAEMNVLASTVFTPNCAR